MEFARRKERTARLKSRGTQLLQKAFAMKTTEAGRQSKNETAKTPNSVLESRVLLASRRLLVLNVFCSLDVHITRRRILT